MRQTFPWLNTDDIDMASYSLEEEGFFDTRALLEAFKRKNLSNGVKYVKGEVTKFTPVHCVSDPELVLDPAKRVNPGVDQMMSNVTKSYATMVTPQGMRLKISHQFGVQKFWDRLWNKIFYPY